MREVLESVLFKNGLDVEVERVLFKSTVAGMLKLLQKTLTVDLSAVQQGISKRDRALQLLEHSRSALKGVCKMFDCTGFSADDADAKI